MNEYDDDSSLDEYGDEITSTEFYDDDEYDDFLAREFPDQTGGSSSVKSHWRWTAWILIALFGLLWMSIQDPR